MLNAASLTPGSCAIPPEVPEPVRGKLRVSDGVLYIFVAEIVLQSPCVVTIVREFVSAGVLSM